MARPELCDFSPPRAARLPERFEWVPRGYRRKHRQSELSDFGDESRQFARLFAEPAPTTERAPLDSTGGIGVDVKTEGGLLYGVRLPAVKWFLLSILSLKPS